MVKEYSLFEHPADLGLQARGDSLAELLEVLAEGMAQQLYDPDLVEPREQRRFEVQAEGIEELLVRFLSQTLWVIQTQRWLVHGVSVRDVSERGASVELRGEPYDPGRHELHLEIKAVTWHDLAIASQPGAGWRGRVIFDI